MCRGEAGLLQEAWCCLPSPSPCGTMHWGASTATPPPGQPDLAPTPKLKELRAEEVCTSPQPWFKDAIYSASWLVGWAPALHPGSPRHHGGTWQRWLASPKWSWGQKRCLALSWILVSWPWQNQGGQQEAHPPECIPHLLPCCWRTAPTHPCFIMETTNQVICAAMSYTWHALVQRKQAVVFAPVPRTIF